MYDYVYVYVDMQCLLSFYLVETNYNNKNQRENNYFSYFQISISKQYLMSLKVDIAQVQYGRQNSKDGRLVFGGEAENFHGSEQTQEVLRIILPRYRTVSSLNGDKRRVISEFCISACQD